MLDAEATLMQLERFDGTGFPNHLAGGLIPLGARILALASDYDNLQLGALAPQALKAEDATTTLAQGHWIKTLWHPAVLLLALYNFAALMADYGATYYFAIRSVDPNGNISIIDVKAA